MSEYEDLTNEYDDSLEWLFFWGDWGSEGKMLILFHTRLIYDDLNGGMLPTLPPSPSRKMCEGGPGRYLYLNQTFFRKISEITSGT